MFDFFDPFFLDVVVRIKGIDGKAKKENVSLQISRIFAGEERKKERNSFFNSRKLQFTPEFRRLQSSRKDYF